MPLKQEVICGKNIEALKSFPDNHFDSIVTDPPYGISFMNKHWDYDIPTVALWKEIIRVLKPGGHLLCACGTRTQHRMAVNIEDAGFEIRDVITWHYGSGFPKSHNISIAIDKMRGAVEVRGKGFNAVGQDRQLNENKHLRSDHPDYVKPEGVTPDAKQWEGYGTAIKPATEFWTLARKPLQENTVAENVLKFGTGGINVDGCRIMYEEGGDAASNPLYRKNNGYKTNYGTDSDSSSIKLKDAAGEMNINPQGRFPSNLILDEFAAALLDEQSGISKSIKSNRGVGLTDSNIYGKGDPGFDTVRGHADSGGASRFFYVAKPSTSERQKGLQNFEDKDPASVTDFRPTLKTNPENWTNGTENPYIRTTPKKNNHPTVKPVELMRYLVRLITPKGGIVCDPYNGSGTTGIACKLEGMNYVGIEQDEYYCKISTARIAAWNNVVQETLF